MEFQNIQIDFGALDTFTDPSAIPNGALTTAENVTSQTDGRYSKRFGYSALPAITTNSITPSTSVRLAKRNKELLFLDQTSIWNYDSAGSKWSGAIPIPNGVATQQYIALEQSKDFKTGSRASYGNYTLHAYIDSADQSVRVYLFNSVDNVSVGGFIDNATQFDVVHTATVGTRVVVFYSSPVTQVIKFCLVDPSTETFGAINTFASGADVYAGTVGYPHSPFDICAVNATDVLVLWADDTPQIKLQSHNVYGNAMNYNVTVANEEPDGGIAVLAVAGEMGTAMWHATTGNLRARGFTPSTGAAVYSTVTVDATAGNFNCGLVRVNSTSHLAVWDVRKSPPLKGVLRWRTISVAGSLGTQVDRYNVTLQSKPFAYNDNCYVNVQSNNRTQETYFTILIRDSFSFYVPIAMHAFRTAYPGGAAIANLTDIDQPSAGVFAFDSPIAYKFLSTNAPKAGMVSYFTDFADVTRFQHVEIGNAVHFTGSVNFRYDGLSVENNFLLYPEITDATPGAVGSAGMDDGTYSYIVVFESSDSNGNTDRSTTSLPVSAITVAGAGLGNVTLTIDHLFITGRIYSSETIVASIFRTESNGETYYCVGSHAIDPTAENFTFVDSKHDSLIINNRIVYTQGGILDREPAPPAKQFVVHQNRVWGVASVDPKLIFYSGDYLPGESLWFSSIQQFRIDDGGDITALASLDEKLVIFKADRIFKVIGRGSNSSGSGNDLTPPALISSDSGCIEQRSIVKTPDGVMFQSKKGIFLLTRGEEVTYIGKPVSRYLDSYPNVTSATMLSTVFEVRFEVSNDAGDEGATLVYNYRDNRWTTHVNYPNAAPRIDALSLNDIYHACAGSVIYIENSGFRDPSNTYIQSTVETGWIAPAGKQGLVRTQRILFLNELMEDHDLEIEIDKDYVDSSVQSVSYAAADITALPQEQVSIHLQDQQGEAWRVRLKDLESDGTNSEGFRAKGILLLSGVKRGSFEKNMQAASKG